MILDGLEREETESPKKHHRSKSGNGTHHRRKSSTSSLSGSMVSKAVEPALDPEKSKIPVVISYMASMDILLPDEVSVRAKTPSPVLVHVPLVAAPASVPVASAAAASVLPVNPPRFSLAPTLKKKSATKLQQARTTRLQVESEFLVLRQNQATGEYDQQRVLMIGQSRITEADVERGDTVVALDTSDLVHVEEISFGAGEEMGPVVRAEFMSRGGLQETKSVYSWRTLDAIDGAKFFARLQAIEVANRSGQNNLCKCVSCGHVFSLRLDEDDMPCPVCQSTLAARFSRATDVAPPPSPGKKPSVPSLSTSDDLSQQQPTLSNSSGTISSLVGGSGDRSARKSQSSLSSSSSAQLPEYLGQRDLDHGLEVFLKIKILVDANSERFFCLVKTDVATFTERSPMDLEKPVWVMLTSERLYILSLSEQGFWGGKKRRKTRRKIRERK